MYKVLFGELSLKLNPKRNKNEGKHWRDLYKEWKKSWQLKQEISEHNILEICSKIYLLSSIEECEIILLDDFQWSQESLVYKVEGYDLNQINFIDKILNRCFYLIESLERTKYANEMSRVGQTEHGVICYDSRDFVIGKSIEIYGEWASEELLILKECINNGDTIIDVGANIGVHTLRFSQIVGNQGKVYAFEPQRLVFQKLCATIALNDLENVFAYNNGLGDKDRIAIIKSVSSGNLGNFSIEAQQTELGDEEIKIITLDSLKLKRCNLIKVDVEGMEECVLRGAMETIINCRPILFIENNISEKSESLLNLILSLEYDCWWHFAPYFNENNFYDNKINIFSQVDRPEINIVCFPKEAHAELNLKKIKNVAESWTDIYHV